MMVIYAYLLQLSYLLSTSIVFVDHVVMVLPFSPFFRLSMLNEGRPQLHRQQLCGLKPLVAR